MRFRLDLAPDQAARLGLRALTEVNVEDIVGAGQTGKFPVLSGLHDKTIRYVKTDTYEDWKSWKQVQADRFGDCEDLSAAIAAELIAAGVPARPVSYKAKKGTWHVVVEYKDPNDGIVKYGDPSVLGGMLGVA